jgi:hypothetical protein
MLLGGDSSAGKPVRRQWVERGGHGLFISGASAMHSNRIPKDEWEMTCDPTPADGERRKQQ